ncbi:Peptidase [Sphingobium herbicidovorans NBRC 16415]|uniref:Peptidase n=1 Tax=Sphingobium herbicidovorans (strain ATCC 700291 / DSM 11019 / CCUG 56400 / KCTC 2939 / LMG 18315 / NBRC 16415 / MH) TaxID=1219045 RepID=A0A086P4R6_SPHHM|nr:hypothetical protein [Sphingobium herbicidovorans]KFG88384.1 Peptidase [Sphingobium herbicidovorans NBRC 16415]
MTWSGQKLLAAIGLAGTVALGGCGYDNGYYGGVSVGSGYYAGGYYDDYWGPGYYQPGYYGGWYNGFYYPGSGYYVYDRGGRRHRWNDGQRRYWEGRRGQQAQRGDHWRGNLARPEQGERRSWRGGRGRDRGDAVAPPVARSEPRGGSPRGSWSGGRSGRSGDSGGSRSDGDNNWRGTLRR